MVILAAAVVATVAFVSIRTTEPEKNFSYQPQKQVNPVSDTCNAKESELCDRSCLNNEDCKQACPIGCVNIDQNYQPLSEVACEQITCECIDNQCQPQYEHFEDR